jgi:hypothetical protein
MMYVCLILVLLCTIQIAFAKVSEEFPIRGAHEHNMKKIEKKRLRAAAIEGTITLIEL